MKYLFFKLLPKNLLSRLTGVLADLKLPSPALVFLARMYSRVYKVNLGEMETSVENIRTFNEFFGRKLKPEARPIDRRKDGVVSPVDGLVSQFGKIDGGFLVQTKGVLYSLSDLIGGEAALFNDGYFVVIYLSPGDYHRIHAPFAGQVEKFSYFSGNLWPVNDFAVKSVGGLFSVNERIVTFMKGDNCDMAMVKVGAMNVGKIKVTYSKVTSNSKIGNSPLQLPVDPPRKYEKGEEIGRFQLGSTVILIFKKGCFAPVALYKNKRVKMGEIIGKTSTTRQLPAGS